MDAAIDHLVYATGDLQEGIATIEALFGLPASIGGSHPGMGTRNALVALGPSCYLEIIGPDPQQQDFQGERIFGIDKLEYGQLVHWCIRRNNLEKFVLQLQARGIPLSDVMAMSRVTAAGQRIGWELAFPSSFGEGSVLPFFIDWGASPHPAPACQQGAELKHFEIGHPDASKINDELKAMSIEPCVIEDSRQRYRAIIQCPRGEVEL